MTYTEWLRVRRTLLVYSIVLVSILVSSIIAIFFTHTDVTVSSQAPSIAAAHAHSATKIVPLREAMVTGFLKHHTTVPLSILFFMAGFLATIVATVLACSLSTERNHTPLSWTKPASRVRFALAYLGVDTAGVAIAFIIALVVSLILIWSVGVASFIRVDRDAGLMLLMMAGIALAYHGVIRAASVGFAGRGGAIAGSSWGVAYLLIALANVPFPRPYHVTFVALNFLNPLAYITDFTDSSTWSGIVPLSVGARIACVWLLALVTATITLTIYRRAEA
ncbi:MAG: hypothetical protein JO060_08010 [Candidatus Eremiobacteraeota bacterium]|nr:hypothetical protein [Candidatus Eremiobacteraeota bacterium]